MIHSAPPLAITSTNASSLPFPFIMSFMPVTGGRAIRHCFQNVSSERAMGNGSSLISVARLPSYISAPRSGKSRGEKAAGRTASNPASCFSINCTVFTYPRMSFWIQASGLSRSMIGGMYRNRPVPVLCMHSSRARRRTRVRSSSGRKSRGIYERAPRLHRWMVAGKVRVDWKFCRVET